MIAIGQLKIRVQNYAEIVSVGTLVDNARLSAHNWNGDALADYSVVQNFHLRGGLFCDFPRDLKINLLLVIHIIDGEQGDQ